MKTFLSKKTISGLLIVLFLFNSAAIAQKKELKILFVGNSYTLNNNLAQIVSLLSEHTSTKLITRKSAAGGSHLWQHWNGEKGLKTKEIIKKGKFDIVVLQDFSMSAIETPDSTYKYVKLFADYIKKHGAKTFLYNTWARKKVPQHQKIIDQVYIKSAKDNNATRVPVGPAWQLAQQFRPSIELYIADGSHPSSLATFLTACIFIGKITGEYPKEVRQFYSIKDIDGESVNLMHVFDLDAEFCMRVAKTVIEQNTK